MILRNALRSAQDELDTYRGQMADLTREYDEAEDGPVLQSVRNRMAKLQPKLIAAEDRVGALAEVYADHAS